MNISESAEVLLTNFIPLPENLQKEVIDFAHFLYLKYQEDNFEENIEKIYEPFYSTKPTTGIGLGLGYIAKLIASYKGSIDVISSPQEQTKFIVRIPFTT